MAIAEGQRKGAAAPHISVSCCFGQQSDSSHSQAQRGFFGTQQKLSINGTSDQPNNVEQEGRHDMASHSMRYGYQTGSGDKAAVILMLVQENQLELREPAVWRKRGPRRTWLSC